MPWLSRRSSAEDGTKPVDHAGQNGSLRSVESIVKFIPAQIDGLCGTTPKHHKHGALRLMIDDVRIIIRVIGSLPAMAAALSSVNVLRSLFKNPVDARDTVLHFCIALVQIWMLIAFVPAFISLPGILFAGFIISCWGITLAMTWPLSGPRVITFEGERAPMTDEFSDEKWLYVNGMMCSNRSLYNQCSRLSNIFGRPVTGIRNHSAGLILDIITILLQHCFNIPTLCTLTLYAQIRDACLTNSIRKVILVGHSTGALHISIALDQLHASIPVEALSKLEIYTFGSAAAHLSNPRLSIDHPGSGAFNCTRPDGSIVSPVKATLATLGHRIEDHERVIPHIEHYALASDIFARCGVLHNTRNMLDNRFCGRVFVLGGHTIRKANGDVKCITTGGFMMNEHYLEILFPTDARYAMDVLNQVVEVEIDTAEKREFTAQGVALPQKAIIMRSDSEIKSRCPVNSPDVSPKTKNRGSWELATTMGLTSVAKARVAAKECEGKTVKQLSRLWRYMHGGRPVGEGVALVNGVGNAHGEKGVSTNGIGTMQ